MATISAFGSSSSPADNGSNTGATVTVTPVSNMVAGMLCLMFVNVRQGAMSWSEIDWVNKGGQAWHEIVLDDPSTSFNGTNITSRLYGCIFNGTWSASPSLNGTVATCVTARMDVWQSDDASYEFDLDTMVVGTTFTAGTTRTIAAITTQNDNALVVAYWLVAAANTWSNLAGTGSWAFMTVGGANQVRNTAGSDNSTACAYKVQATAGTTGTISADQSASTAGVSVILSFKLVARSELYPTTRPTVDLLIDHEASTDGTIITPTILAGCTESIGSKGTWSATGGTAQAIRISGAAEMRLAHEHGLSLQGTPQEYNDSNATRGAAYSHTQGAETPSFNFSFASTQTKLSMGFFYRTSYLLQNLASFSSIAIFADGTGEFTVWNVLAQFPNDYVTRLECNTAPGLVCGAHILKEHTYWVCMLMDTTNSVSKLAIYDVENNWRKHGFTTYLPIVGSSPINRLQIYCTGGGYVAAAGYSYYDDFALDYTNAVFPLLPGTGGAVPPPPLGTLGFNLRM